MQNIITIRIIFLLTIAFSFKAYSQSKITYLSSGDAIKKGIGAHDRKSYKSAIKYFNKVHKGDTNYLVAQYEKCNTYFAMEEYQKAIDIAEEALEKPNISASEFYNLLGSAYDEMDNHEKAISVYTKAIEEFPMFYRTYFNRAVTYQRMEKLDSAVLDYQQTLTLNPYHTTSHYKLGELALKEGEIAKAMLCFNSYLLMEPGNNTSFLAKFNDMVQGDFEEDSQNIKLSTDDYAYLNELILSKKAMENSYKTPNKLGLPIVKQNYLLFTELQKRDLGDGFWYSYYAPFFIEIMEREKFNDLMYYSIQSSTNEGIVKVLEKNIKKINAFPDWAGDLWQSKHSTDFREIDGKRTEITYSWLNGSAIEGWSEIKDGTPQGKSEYFHYNGRLNALGNINANGKQEGKWVYYYNTGELAGVEYYKDGKIQGTDTAYWKNGLIKTSDTYKDGESNGLSVSYFESGANESETNYEEGLPNGEAIYYYEIGLPHYQVNYKNDKLNGDFMEYAPNHQISEKSIFKDDKRTGHAMEYYMDGKKRVESNYVDGVYDGAYKSWYHNGNVREESTYKDGALIGKYVSYNPNGSISSIANYDESGKESGDYQEFDKAGNLNVELTYKKGEMIAYKIYHRDGTLLKESKKSNKEFLFENFYSDGTRKTTGVYQPGDEGKNGIWKFYDKNGVLESEEHYVNGKLNGRSVSYYINGVKSNASYYTNDVLDGYSVEYYPNGKMKSQGYYIANNLEGNWINYQENGTKTAEMFYVLGKLNGPQTYYNVDGSLDLMETYKMDQLVEFELFDTLGVSYQKETTTPDSSTYSIKSFSGATLRVFNRKYYITQGPSTNYHGNGQISRRGEYFFNQQDGPWQSFHENGELEKTGIFFVGKKIGKWNRYSNKGVLVEEEDYEYGELHGFNTGYHDNGKLDYKIPYENNTAHGTASYYDGNGVLQFYREYYYGKIVGYSFNGKDGKPVETTPIINETGKVKSYFPNGNVSREFEMLNGQFVNTYSEYYENGKLMAQSNYKNGTINGNRFEYYENGKVKSEEPMVDGNKQGICKYFDENGKLTKTQTYLVNELHGPTKYYDTNGKVTKTVNYFDDIIISDQ